MNKNTDADIRPAVEAMMSLIIDDDVIDGLPGIFYILDEQGRLTRWNRRFSQVTGYDDGDLAGRSVLEFCEIADRPMVTERIRQVFTTGTASAELNLVAKNGRRIPHRFSGWRVDRNGQAFVCGLGLDFTEHRRVEAEQVKSEVRFQAIFEGSHDAIVLIRDGSMIDCNQQAVRLFGCQNKAEFLDLHPGDVSAPIQPDGADSFAAADDRMRLAMDSGVHRFEWLVRRKDGTDVLVEVLLSAFYLDGHRILQAAARDISERKALERQLEHQANFDELTGLPNRRYFIHRAGVELQRVRRHASPLALLLFDVDHFKQINDRYGHPAGDAVLRAIGQCCRSVLRAVDLPGRIGGEEFAVLLPETDHSQAREAAERLRRAMAALEVPSPGGGCIRFTVSIGLTAPIASDQEFDDLFCRADAALYQAKHGGRDQVFATFEP